MNNAEDSKKNYLSKEHLKNRPIINFYRKRMLNKEWKMLKNSKKFVSNYFHKWCMKSQMNRISKVNLMKMKKMKKIKVIKMI